MANCIASLFTNCLATTVSLPAKGTYRCCRDKLVLFDKLYKNLFFFACFRGNREKETNFTTSMSG